MPVRLPEVFDAQSCVLFVCCVRASPASRAIRHRDGRRHGPRRVGRGDCRRESHADQRRNRHLVVKTSTGGRQLRVPGRAARASTSSPARRPASRWRWSTTSQVQVGARLRVDLQMPVGQVTREGRGHRDVAARRNRFEPARPGHHRRPDARAAAHLARVFVAGAADDGREARRLVADDRQHAARRGVQRQRPAQRVQQLPDRRRRQQRLRHEQPGLLEPGDAADARRDRRVQGRHQQHERRVRARRRRHDQRQLPQRHQPLPRQRLGVPPQRRAERDRLLQAGQRQAGARPATSSAACSAARSSRTRRSSSATTKGSGRRAR